jgi:hypothetical protein
MLLVDFVRDHSPHLKSYLDKDVVRSLVDLFKKDFPEISAEYYKLGISSLIYPRQKVVVRY